MIAASHDLRRFWCVGISVLIALIWGGGLMACEIEATVQAYDPSGQEVGHADNLRGALGTRDFTRPALVFALEAEAALYAALENEVCREGQTIKLDLSFVQMELIASADSIARFREILQGRKGPYATVSYDPGRGTVTAMIEWNPSQILRDQLSLLGWDVDNTSTLAIDEAAYWNWSAEYEEKVLFASPPASSLSAWDDLRKVVPPDLFGLFSQKHPLSTRGNLASFALSLMNRALEISQPGYSGMTEMAIRRALDDPAASPVNSVSDAIAAGFPQPYEKLRWLRPADVRVRQLNWE